MWERVALEQVSLRWSNERAAEGSIASGLVRVRCECGRDDCAEWIELPTASYQDVRRDGSLFLVVRAHGVPEVDRVVERRGRFDVVEAHGAAGEIARDLSP